MNLNWWPIFVVLAVATVWDISSRRIPNWLVLPFLVAGLVMHGMARGVAGMGFGLGGIAVAAALMGPLCWLRGMGMGDLKLCAAIGAWIGPGQMFFALVMTGLAGGLFGLGYAACHRSLGRSLDGSGDLIAGALRGRIGPSHTLDNPAAMSIPYAPAIAVGTIFAFLAR